jgi:DNA-binding transcriptional MerR regulator
VSTLRIGEIAERTGVTPRTIRYYEELGLLPRSEREQGKHRVYTEADIERLKEVTRLRDLLGLSLAELRSVVVAEAVRADARRRFHASESPAERRRALEDALPHLEVQLSLVRRRLDELKELETDLLDRRRRIQRNLRELED